PHRRRLPRPPRRWAPSSGQSPASPGTSGGGGRCMTRTGNWWRSASTGRARGRSSGGWRGPHRTSRDDGERPDRSPLRRKRRTRAMERTELITNLLRMPEQIAQAEERFLKAQERLRDARACLEDRRAELLTKVRADGTPYLTGKNAEQREAQLHEETA